MLAKNYQTTGAPIQLHCPKIYIKICLPPSGYVAWKSCISHTYKCFKCTLNLASCVYLYLCFSLSFALSILCVRVDVEHIECILYWTYYRRNEKNNDDGGNNNSSLQTSNETKPPKPKRTHNSKWKLSSSLCIVSHHTMLYKIRIYVHIVVDAALYLGQARVSSS